MDELEKINRQRKRKRRRKRYVGTKGLMIFLGLIVIFFLLCLFVFRVPWMLDMCHISRPADTISIVDNGNTLGVGQKTAIKVVMEPENTNSTYEIKSNNPKIISIDKESKKLVAKASGKCKITVITDNEKTDVKEYIVLEEPTKLNIIVDDRIMAGKSVQAEVKAGKNEAATGVVFESSDSNIAVVSKNGLIKPKKIGTFVIKATAYNNVSSEKEVQVCKAATKIVLEEKTVYVDKGTTAQIAYKLGKNEYPVGLKYKVADKSIASVSDTGVVKGLKPGKTKVTVSLSNGVSASCNVVCENKRHDIRENLDSSKKMVALTFDDGPHESNTRKILSILEKYNARATFFLIGYQVPEYPDIVLDEFNAGHEIGNHSWNHGYASNLSPSEQIDQLSKCNEAIKQATGNYPTVFRCPGGETSATYQQYANMPIILWSIDTRDWDTLDTDSTVNSITSVIEEKGLDLDGDIVLMHDIHEPTVPAVERICKYLSDKGYLMVTVSELAHYKGVEMQNGKIYNSFYSEDKEVE